MVHLLLLPGRLCVEHIEVLINDVDFIKYRFFILSPSSMGWQCVGYTNIRLIGGYIKLVKSSKTYLTLALQWGRTGA